MGRFSTPKFFIPGVKHRVLPAGQVPGCPLFRDVFKDKIVPENEWLDAIRAHNSVRMDESVWTVLDQNGVGSCASEAMNGGGMLVRALAGRSNVIFNPYGMYGRVNGGYDQGSSLDANVAFALKYGCFPENVWPRSKGWRTEPSDEAYEAASHYKLDEAYDCDNSSASAFYAEFFSSLLLEHPVYFGYSGHAILAVRVVEESQAPPEARYCDQAVAAWLAKRGKRHSPPCDLVGNLYIKYLNSWGNWGDNGFGYLKASRIERSYGAFPLRTMISAE